MQDVREKRTVDVPQHLQDAHYAGAKRLGHGANYVYPHDAPDGYASQAYGVPRGTYYHPVDRGKESEFRARLAELDQRDADEA
jgi:putative ATPase